MDRSTSIHPSLAAKFRCRAAGVFLLTAASAFGNAENLARYAKGVLAEQAGDHEAARGHFKATLAADPDSFTVARKAASHEDLAGASGILRDFAAGHPDHLGAQLHYTDFLRHQARGDAMAQKVAGEILTAANERFPHTPAVFTGLIEVLEDAEDREASLAVFEAEMAAEHHDPAAWVALIPLARNLIPGEAPEYRTTLDTLHDRAARDGIASPSIARRVSDYHRQQGNADRSIAVLEEHIAAVPNSLELRTRLGLLLAAAGREDDGRKVLEDSVAIDPDYTYAHQALARYYEKSGDTERALHHHAEVLRVQGGAAADFLEIANKYLDTDNPHAARLLLERARFDHPEHPAVAARLAIATLRDGDTTGAAHVFRQAEALAEDSNDPEVKEALGSDFQIDFAQALRTAGDLEAAEARLRNAARNAPEDQPEMGAKALRELARLWLDQDKNQGPAISLLKRAQALDPENEETAALLERAKEK